jgi:hypothetical protein
MTNELRDRLDRARALAPAPRFDVASTRRRSKRRAATRRVGIAVFALAIGAAGLGGTVLAFDRSSQGAPGAGPSPAPALAPGQFLYRETTHFWVDTCGVGGDTQGCNLGTRDDLRDAVMQPSGDELRVPAIEPQTSRLWWTASGAARLWEHSMALLFFRPEDRARFEDLYGTDTVRALPPEDRSFGPGEFDTPDRTFPGWSRDPATLALQLERAASPNAPSPVPLVSPGPGQGPSTGAEVRLLDEMLPVATPDFQQALFEAARSVQGMQVVEGATDPGGRPAVELRIVTEGAMRTWFFDPTSHLLLGGTLTSPDSGFAWEAWYVSQVAIVNSTEERPDPSESLVPAATGTPSFVDPRTL